MICLGHIESLNVSSFDTDDGNNLECAADNFACDWIGLSNITKV